MQPSSFVYTILPQSDQQPMPTHNLNKNQAARENSLAKRVKKRPTWMKDYVTSGIRYEDTLAHFAFLVDCDPFTFQEAIKDSKWQHAMNEEIASIEKNNS